MLKKSHQHFLHQGLLLRHLFCHRYYYYQLEVVHFIALHHHQHSFLSSILAVHLATLELAAEHLVMVMHFIDPLQATDQLLVSESH